MFCLDKCLFGITIWVLLSTRTWARLRQTKASGDPDSVCFHIFGCFQTHGAIPVPQTPEEVDTHLHLFHRNGHSNADIVFDVDTYQRNVAHFASNFDASKKTNILIHGFISSINSTWMLPMKDALLAKGDFNVIVVDWGAGSHNLYHVAVGNTFLVGSEVAHVLKYLHTHRHLRYQDVHIIGHSLGAQIAGHVGHSVHGIGRISGLDPADPEFHGQPTTLRLDKSDAMFVDIIHTDASGFIGISGYGMREPMGHIDFYPNGGQHQTGCAERPLSGIIQSLIHGSLTGAKTALICSHTRAAYYFMESIMSACKFRAHSCSSFSAFDNGECLSCPPSGCPIMGYDADSSSSHGSFYLSTSNKAAFCGTEYFVEVDLAHKIDTTHGKLNITLVGRRGSSEELEFTRAAEGFTSDSVHRHVIATHTDIGDVVGVKVKFEVDYHDSPNTRIHRVIVKKAGSNTSTALCGNDVLLQSGKLLTIMAASGC